MNDVFQSVDGGDFAFATFIRASCDDDFVIFSDWYAADLKGKSVSDSISGRQ